MKKILSLVLLSALICPCEVFAFSPTFSNPTASTMDFYPMMRRQMEQDETLDFENDPEHYKEKRQRADEAAEYRAGNKNFNPHYNSSTGLKRLNTQQKNLEFTTDSKGNIIIKDSTK